MKKNKPNYMLLLHGLLVLYSFTGIFSKIASGYQIKSIGFIVSYGTVLLLLGIYALGWQQIIKKIPLTTAYANKSVTVIWGIVWGGLFFHEKLTLGKLLGAILIIAGIFLFALSDNGRESHE